MTAEGCRALHFSVPARHTMSSEGQPAGFGARCLECFKKFTNPSDAGKVEQGQQSGDRVGGARGEWLPEQLRAARVQAPAAPPPPVPPVLSPPAPPPLPPAPPWRQPRGKSMVSLVNSHTNAIRIGWHLWEIDLKFAPGLPPGWLKQIK